MLRKRNLNDLSYPDSISETILPTKNYKKNNLIKNFCLKKHKQKKGNTTKDELEYDFDKESSNDCYSFSDYANDVFIYLRYREQFFKVSNYLPNQRFINSDTRARLVNWLVEIQETFELNHETLYLSVKLLDIYLDNISNIFLNQLQLISSSAVLLASKFEEKSAPLIDDFIYLSNDFYKRDEIKQAEREILRAVKFDLGAPISYSFLRRYARVTKLDMTTLTLARYYLETSLMFLDFCRVSESLMALACYLVAVRARKIGDWSNILQKYSGYRLDEVEPLSISVNHMIIRVHKNNLNQTIQKKYSHEIFFEVALIASMPDQLPETAPIGPPNFF